MVVKVPAGHSRPSSGSRLLIPPFERSDPTLHTCIEGLCL